jgi:hypothetical protein
MKETENNNKPKVKQNPEQQRNFFDEFAKSKNFDPLIIANWYDITVREIVKAVSSSHFFVCILTLQTGRW